MNYDNMTAVKCEGEGLNRHLVIKYVDHKEEVSE